MDLSSNLRPLLASPYALEIWPYLRLLNNPSQLADALRDHSELLVADHDGKTLLAIAAEVGNLDAMRVLLDCGADPRASDGSALHQAAFHGQTAAVELLLDAGVHVDCSGQPAVVEDPDDPDARVAEGPELGNGPLVYVPGSSVDFRGAFLLFWGTLATNLVEDKTLGVSRRGTD